jgi:Mg2+ and Co2+ transporter CorA
MLESASATTSFLPRTASGVFTSTSAFQKITQLAFLYVPLSFVTNILGMNVKNINGSPLPMWVPVAAFLVASTCTLEILETSVL